MREEARARLAVLLAAMLPMLIWPLGKGQLLHPWPVAVGALFCAGLAATAPGRGLRLAAWLLLVLMPSTLAWLATVAVTGVGPSLASVESLTAGAYREVIDAAGLALRTPAFLLVALLSMAGAWLALRLARRCAVRRGGPAAWLFLVALVPLFLMVAVQHVRWVQGAAAWFGPEVHISVPALFQLGAARSLVSETVDNLTMAGERRARPPRDASMARVGFRAEPGVAIFLVGESMRHDALMRPGRGPASDQLAARLAAGLGLRLPDVCAGGNGTFISVPKLLTLSQAPDPVLADGQPTLLAMAKAAGARTAYVNNHEIWVVPETGHDWQEKLSTSYFSASDERAIAVVEDFLRRERAPAKAALVHMYGQHFPYEERYPASMFPHEPAGLSAPAREELRYARASEFGTHVLMRLARFLDRLDEPAYLVFTSDHGENLPSDGTGKQFHAGPVNGRNDTLVPALVLWNRAFADADRPRRLAALAAAPAPLAHRDVAAAWLRLLGDPSPLAATPQPQTWGALHPGDPVGVLPCRSLGP
jgi:glucan phosphoethanolaminetransferase (alkaline phosphatase superfamily)